jgi:hypothetical protein
MGCFVKFADVRTDGASVAGEGTAAGSFELGAADAAFVFVGGVVPFPLGHGMVGFDGHLHGC